MTLNCNNIWNKRATEGHGGNEFTEKDADHVEKQEFLEIHLNLTWKKDKTNIAEEGKVSQAGVYCMLLITFSLYRSQHFTLLYFPPPARVGGTIYLGNSGNMR